MRRLILIAVYTASLLIAFGLIGSAIAQEPDATPTFDKQPQFVPCKDYLQLVYDSMSETSASANAIDYRDAEQIRELRQQVLETYVEAEQILTDEPCEYLAELYVETLKAWVNWFDAHLELNDTGSVLIESNQDLLGQWQDVNRGVEEPRP